MMAKSSAGTTTLSPPEIMQVCSKTISYQRARTDHGQDDLRMFHEKHFSIPSVNHFEIHFLGPISGENEQGLEEVEQEEEVEEDGLGYYPDGVKRTLTDEQIAMFRHSEIQAILRARRHAAELDENILPEIQAPNNEEGEIEEDSTKPDEKSISPRLNSKPAYHTDGRTSNAKGQKRHKKRGAGILKQSIKPDLRKRTWDIVDTGLESLDYGEGPGGKDPGVAPRRRRISYEDM